MLLVSSVWQHRYDAIMVRRGNEHIDIQLTLSLVSLFCQYVPRMRMATLDLSRSRKPESLGSTFVRFKFWHRKFPSLKFTGSAAAPSRRRRLYVSLAQG